MDRRDFFQAAGASVLLGAAAPGFAATVSAPSWKWLFEAVLEASPETATNLGYDTGARSRLKHRLDDRSAASRFREYVPLVDTAPTLRTRSPSGERDAILGASALWVADSMEPFRAFPYGGIGDGDNSFPLPYIVTQLSGAYQFVPDFLDTQHGIQTLDDAEAYLDRLTALAIAVGQETERVREDAAHGVTPPRVILDRTIAQLYSFQVAQHGEQAGLVQSLVRRATARGIAGQWQERSRSMVDGPIARAISEQLSVLQDLRVKARTTVGVDQLPNGEVFYGECLRHHTSTLLTPNAVHELGVEQVKLVSSRIRVALDEAGIRQGAVVEGIKALKVDPKQLFPNTDLGRAQLLTYIKSLVRDMQARLPRAFSRIPRTPLEVRRIPVENELGSTPAYSQGGSVDGTRPGAIYFNLADTANWPRWTIATTVYHEGVPGHHLQGSIANEDRDLPDLFKVLFTNAYVEGWALYAEQLADELGAYDGEPLGRLGMLQASLFRACRLAVDTGLHSRGWSREQAIAYLIDNAGTTPDDARREIERYCCWPGQACGYKIGHLELLRLRENAKTRLGSRFSLRAFHDEVLGYGSPPFEVLARAVDVWVERQKASPSQATRQS